MGCSGCTVDGCPAFPRCTTLVGLAVEQQHAPRCRSHPPGTWTRAIQFSIFPSLPESSTPSPLAGGEGWDGGEKHGLGTPPACTPTLALPLAQGEGKDRQARVRKLNGPGAPLLGLTVHHPVCYKALGTQY